MSPDTALTIFVFISAIALCIQAGLLFGIYKTARAIEQQALSVMPQVKAILTKADATLDENRKQIADITAKANAVMDLTKTQLVKVDGLLTDASSRAKVQLDRAEMVLDDTMGRIHQSVTAVHSGIVRPVREIQGIAAGVRTAFAYFLRGGRPSVDRATQDDEMFI